MIIMNKSVKTIAIVAAAMVTAGLLLTGIGFILGGNQPIWLDRDGIHLGYRDSGNTSGGELVDFSQDVESFDSISVDLDFYDVDLVPGDRFAIEGSYFSEAGKPGIKVENNTLTVVDSGRKRINISIDLPGLFTYDNHPNIKIYYPEKTEFQSVIIRCDSSDLEFENLTADHAEFELDLGKLKVSRITANNVTVNMDSGDCSVKGIKAADQLIVTNNLGKVLLEDSEAKTLKVDADSGDVTLTGVTFERGDLTIDLGKLTARGIKSKGLNVKADSGDVNVEGELSGVTDIKNSMGAVTVRPGAPRDRFSYELNADLGSVTVDGQNTAGSVAFSTPSSENTLKISTDMGAIKVDFK